MKKTLISLFVLFVLCSKASAAEVFDGLGYFLNNDIKTAKINFEKFVNENPNNAQARFWLGYCQQKLGLETSKITLQEAYELSNLIDEVDFSVILENYNIDDYLDMSLMYLEVKNFAKAVVYNDMALSLNPTSARAQFVRAQIFMFKEDKLSAQNAMGLAIQFDNRYLNHPLSKELEITEVPKLSAQYFNLKALKAYYEADFNTAVSNFEQALEIEPKNANILNNFAQLYISKGDFEEGQTILNKAKFADLKYARTYFNLARIAKIQSENPNLSSFAISKLKAEEKINLNKALKYNFNDKNVYFALGEWYFDAAEYQKAYENFKLAIDLDENFYEAYFGAAKVFIETNQPQKALVALRNAGALNPAANEINFCLAKLCALEGKKQEALDYLKQYESALRVKSRKEAAKISVLRATLN